MVAKPQVMKLYAAILKDKLKEDTKNGHSEIEKICKQIEKQQQRLKNAKELMLDGEFSATDYKEMKSDIEITKLQREKMKYKDGKENIGGKIDECVNLLANINKHYVSTPIAIKQRIISSIFPKKLIFENNNYRTSILIKYYHYKATKSRDLSKIKTGRLLC
jgi:hypothetical protein